MAPTPDPWTTLRVAPCGARQNAFRERQDAFHVRLIELVAPMKRPLEVAARLGKCFSTASVTDRRVDRHVHICPIRVSLDTNWLSEER